MSLGRAAGPILATICGVCTAYAAFAPELQKQAVERFEAQHPVDPSPPSSPPLSPLSPSSPSPPHPTTATASGDQKQTVDPAKKHLPRQPIIISNDESLGKEIKAVVSETKAEVAAAAAEPRAGWFGLGAWKGVFGGAPSPRENEEEKKS